MVNGCLDNFLFLPPMLGGGHEIDMYLLWWSPQNYHELLNSHPSKPNILCKKPVCKSLQTLELKLKC